MIITVEDIRKYREIATNTQRNRVEIFIRETEQLDIVPLLGVAEYDRLNGGGGHHGTGFILGQGILGITELGDGAGLTEEERTLLNGGTWTDSCGCLHRFEGLKAAISYLTFARLIRNHPLQVTPYGVVVKEGDDSSPASAQSIAAVANDSRKIGEQYLADAVKYWSFVSDSCCGKCQAPVRAARRKFYAIGD